MVQQTKALSPLQQQIAQYDPKAALHWYPLRYHAAQSRLWTAIERGKLRIGVAAGRGSGKTEISRRKIVTKCIEKQTALHPNYFYALPTNPQAKKVAWNYILPMIPNKFLAEKNITEQRINFTSGAVLYIVGMDAPERIEGLQYCGGVVDESCDQKPKSYDLTIVPALTHNNGWCWRIGVPKRQGVGAKDFKKFFDEVADESYTWPSSDILTQDQIAKALTGLDTRDVREQFGGEWLSATGGIFHAFNYDKNVSEICAYNPNKHIVVGSDFNVDPMAWCIGHEVWEKQTDFQGKEHEIPVLHIFDTVYLRNTNTRQSLNNLAERYGEHKSGWAFFGDASSRARKTSASDSDYLQIADDSRFINKKIFYPKANPPVADRFASTNRCLQSADGLVRCRIHPRCKELIVDIEERAYKPGTNEPDDYGDVGHCTDGLGYILHTLWPYSTGLEGESSVHLG